MKVVNKNTGWKIWTVIISVILLAGILWAGLVYGKEFADDTKDYIDNIQQEQQQTPETEENTEENLELTITYNI